MKTAAYSPFDAPDGRGTPWALEQIPLPLTVREWSRLETGLIQRARLLEQILADVYGPRSVENPAGCPRSWSLPTPFSPHLP